jgi:hypothetical protein
MPVDQKALLADCRKQLKLLEADLKAQAIALPDLDASLRAEYEDAREAGRVGDAFEIWRGEQVTQGAVHWVLGGVFLRFLEDNALVDPLLTGVGDRGRLAEAAEQSFYAQHPTLHERDWLLQAFRQVSALPGGAALFDEAHNPVFRWPPSSDAAKVFVQFWRRPNPATGELIHDFADAAWDTRFLGDLYQDLSEGARKKYALLQTPVFVEEFILDRTLGEAFKALPLDRVTVIDPTCGSGHFLLGAFARLLSAWEAKEPGIAREALTQRALDQVAGVDLNPFAVAIARFRLVVAALRVCNVTSLGAAPGFLLHVAVGDSLLHGDERGMLTLGDGGRGRFVHHAFGDEDLTAVNAILSRRYAVVVGNPPYITPKDAALNVAYRERYKTCHMRYALSVPFVERFWDLAATDAGGSVAGWVGQITANSFMKREFGKKLIEAFFPRVDLTHVIDTAGAYIPGHGTPTVILLGRARLPRADVVRAVLGIRGEPRTPDDPARGEVWSAIVAQVDEPESESTYVSVTDLARETFAHHPWSIGGGGAGDLKELIEAAAEMPLAEFPCDIGITAVTGEDAFFTLGSSDTARRLGIEQTRALVNGDLVRDWSAEGAPAIWPYDDQIRVISLVAVPSISRLSWTYRTAIASRRRFGTPMVERGFAWYEWQEIYRDKLATPLTITFAEVATHNHFALDRGGSVFKNTAPVIKLPADADEATHLGLIGLLNSSIACFWLKQVAHNKGSTVDQAGARQRSAPFEDFYQFNGTRVAFFPVTFERPTDLASILDALAIERQRHLPRAIVLQGTPGRVALDDARARAAACLARMIAIQEEIDWRCYRLYGVSADELTFGTPEGTPIEPPPLKLGERAFEIALARRMAVGEDESSWFSRHDSTPVTQLPAHWPADYRALVERRIESIESDRKIALIERPEHKRRWNVEAWEPLERVALSSWLLERLESTTYWPQVALQTTRDLAARAALDGEFAQVAALWTGSEGIALEPVIRELVLGESVPFIPALRYTDGGREKRHVWERVWELQRREDEVDAAVAAETAFAAPREGESPGGLAKRLDAAQKVRRFAEVGAVPRPPKYTSSDFQRADYWRVRGALDIPKERFTLYPYCNRDGDDAPLLSWAGWNHLDKARALSAWYADRTQQDGWSGDRVLPMLAGMAELLPWLLQWHNQLDPALGDRPGETYSSWLSEELQAQGLTRAALDGWKPPQAGRRGNRRATAKRAPALVTDDAIMDATADAAE